MRFLYVTKIHNCSEDKISGEVSFSPQEAFRIKLSNRVDHVRLSVVSEAIGQLVSWLSLQKTDFFGRPVFLFASNIELHHSVPTGSVVSLEARISSEDKQSFVFSGGAYFEGKCLVSISDCGGYLMPLAELEDPLLTRNRLAQLQSNTGLPANPESEIYDSSSLVDTVLTVEPLKSIHCRKYFSGNEPFYADHFPRYPVTPIVVINEMISEATRRLAIASGLKGDHMRPVFIRDLKIKSFIKPGSTVEVLAKVIELSETSLETICEVVLDGRKILRGRYGFIFEEQI